MPRVAGLVLAAWALLALALQVAGGPLVRAVQHGDVVAGTLAVLGSVAMFIRWRIDGRAQSWWIATGYFIVAAPGLIDSGAGTGRSALWVCSLAVAFLYFATAWRSPQVDSILSVRRFAAGTVVGLAAALLWARILAPSPLAIRIFAAALALAFGALTVLWRRSDQDKPWFVVPLAGCAVCCATFAIVSNPTLAAANAITAALLVNAVTAATAMAGLQATATRHRALALDAQRERDLVTSLREELEARYAETLHEVRSTVLALEGGIEVFGPGAGASIGTALADSLVAELHRLRAIADPGRALTRQDFDLSDALHHIAELSRANGWQVSWNVAEDILVRGRPDDVAQIVHGLLMNANKYAPGQPVEVSSLAGGQFVLVLVDDHGPGVRPADRERIFERGARANTEASEGQGLGLHIARGQARGLGGELWVEQNNYGGARFVLALRLAVADTFEEVES